MTGENTVKGYNKLLLNEATMIEVVQFWFDAKMTTVATVSAVKSCSGMDGGFEVQLVSTENGEKPK
jgi:hypothetical protein